MSIGDSYGQQEMFNYYAQQNGAFNSLLQAQMSAFRCDRCLISVPHYHAGQPETKPVAKEKTMYDAVKTWFNKHSDLLVTVAAIFLADHFMFGGKFRHKIEQMVDALIDKVAKKVEAHEA